LKDASVQQPPFPCNDPLLFVIPSEASGSAVRHSCAPLLPAHNLHQSSPHGNTNLPLVIPARISCHAALDTVAYAPFS